jgi:hypothetical protein
MNKAKKKFKDLCYKGKVSESEANFFAEYDGVLMNFDTAVKIACLMAIQDLSKVGPKITKESANEHLLKTMGRFNVTEDAILRALGNEKIPPHLPVGSDSTQPGTGNFCINFEIDQLQS